MAARIGSGRRLWIAEQYRAFAHLTYRESGDIETCLSVYRSWASATNESAAALAQRPWRGRCIDGVCALENRCAVGLSVRTTKATVKMRTLSIGNIPSFIRWQRFALDMLLPEADSTRGSWLRRFARVLQPRPETDVIDVYWRRQRPASFATRPSPWTASTPVGLPRAAHPLTPSPARRWSITNVNIYRNSSSSASSIFGSVRVGNAVTALRSDCRCRHGAPRPGRLHFETDPLGSC